MQLYSLHTTFQRSLVDSWAIYIYIYIYNIIIIIIINMLADKFWVIHQSDFCTRAFLGGNTNTRVCHL